MTKTDEHYEPALRQFLTYDNPKVRQPAVAVDINDPAQLAEARQYLDDMVLTLRRTALAGIAGNQVDLPTQYDLIAIDLGGGLPVLKLINAKMTWHSEQSMDSGESCGTVTDYSGSSAATPTDFPAGFPNDSLPPYTMRPPGTVPRWQEVVVEGYDENGNPVRLHATGEGLPENMENKGFAELLKHPDLPRLLQHELEHNNDPEVSNVVGQHQELCRLFIDHLPEKAAILARLDAARAEGRRPPVNGVWPPLVTKLERTSDGTPVRRRLEDDSLAPEGGTGTYIKKTIQWDNLPGRGAAMWQGAEDSPEAETQTGKGSWAEQAQQRGKDERGGGRA